MASGKPKACVYCGGPTPSSHHKYCPPCKLRRPRNKRAPARERGYGKEHRAERKRWKAIIDAGNGFCTRCGRWIEPGSAWDLGHSDFDRSQYRGPEHSFCNRSAAGRGQNGRKVGHQRVDFAEWL
jgi:hypothetical protein